MSPDPFHLDGKTALVTGAGRGLGRAVAIALAAAELVLASRTRSEFEAVAAEIAAQGGRPAKVTPIDVTDTAAVRTAMGGLGRLDIKASHSGRFA